MLTSAFVYPVLLGSYVWICYIFWDLLQLRGVVLFRQMMVLAAPKKTAGPFAYRTAVHARTPIRPAIGLYSPSSAASHARRAPLPGMEIPLYAQPASSFPAVYQLEENGRAFVLYSRDMHRSHAPLRNRAAEHSLARTRTEPQFGQPHFLAHPLGHIQRRTASLGGAEEAEPPEPPPPVFFPFDPWAEDELRRSIPPPPEPKLPRDGPPGYAKATNKRSSTPSSQSHTQTLPLPKLLRACLAYGHTARVACVDGPAANTVRRPADRAFREVKIRQKQLALVTLFVRADGA